MSSICLINRNWLRHSHSQSSWKTRLHRHHNRSTILGLDYRTSYRLLSQKIYYPYVTVRYSDNDVNLILFNSKDKAISYLFETYIFNRHFEDDIGDFCLENPTFDEVAFKGKMKISSVRQPELFSCPLGPELYSFLKRSFTKRIDEEDICSGSYYYCLDCTPVIYD